MTELRERVQLSHVSRSFGQTLAVDDVSLDIKEGELLGLLGINGAGKTTTIKMICGLLKPTAGTIQINGRINFSPQETAVAENLTARENLLFMAGLYGASEEESMKQADRVMEEMKLYEIEDKRAKTLSGGWKRRLSIAMALVTQPEILFLDEPTLGLDVIARRSLWETIRQLHERMTIVLTTHYLEEAEALCDRIAVMKGGRLCAIGTAEELKIQAGCNNFEEAFIKLAGGNGKRGGGREA